MHWFKKCNFWKNSLSHFRGRWGQEVIFEVAEAKFWISSSFNKFWFRIFVVLGFKVVWPQRPRRPQKGLREFFQKLHFWNQGIPTKKMRYVTASWSKFSLNISTEEVWHIMRAQKIRENSFKASISQLLVYIKMQKTRIGFDVDSRPLASLASTKTHKKVSEHETRWLCPKGLRAHYWAHKNHREVWNFTKSHFKFLYPYFFGLTQFRFLCCNFLEHV